MKLLNRMLGTRSPRRASVSDVEVRFLRLYSQWHETHDLSLRKRLLVRLNLVMRRMPNFNMRNRFKHAF